MNLIQNNNYKGYNWSYHDWAIGERITEEHIDNIENGILINANLINDLSNRVLRIEANGGGSSGSGEITPSTPLIDAIVAEIGGSYANSSFSNSRIDVLENNYNEVTAKTSSIENQISPINQNISDLQQRVTTLERGSSDSGASSAEVDALINEIYGSPSTSGPSRIDNLENKAAPVSFIQSTNTSVSDTISISRELQPNTIVFIALRAATSGSSSLKVRDSTGSYFVYKDFNNSTIAQKIQAGTILGFYYTGTGLYLFNTPFIF